MSKNDSFHLLSTTFSKDFRWFFIESIVKSGALKVWSLLCKKISNSWEYSSIECCCRLGLPWLVKSHSISNHPQYHRCKSSSFKIRFPLILLKFCFLVSHFYKYFPGHCSNDLSSLVRIPHNHLRHARFVHELPSTYWFHKNLFLKTSIDISPPEHFLHLH